MALGLGFLANIRDPFFYGPGHPPSLRSFFDGLLGIAERLELGLFYHLNFHVELLCRPLGLCRTCGTALIYCGCEKTGHREDGDDRREYQYAYHRPSNAAIRLKGILPDLDILAVNLYNTLRHIHLFCFLFESE